MSDQIPILLDTDIGSDIDDAVALAYLLRQPRCNLLGITTVTGDVAKRCACAEVVCSAAGRGDIPIHAGRSAPLVPGPGQPEVPQYTAIAAMKHRRDWPAHTAVDFLRRTIRSHPGEITLLTIGPLGNIALLFAVDPEIPLLLKRIVSMAGIFYGAPQDREWNILVDPVAASMVYSTSRAQHVSFGLDVTTRCKMAAAQVRQRFTASPLDVVARMAEVWFNHAGAGEITFHDPLAAAAIFQPDLCHYEDGTVQVPLDPDNKTAGITHFTSGAGGRQPDLVAKTVQVERFFTEYFKVFA